MVVIMDIDPDKARISMAVEYGMSSVKEYDRIRKLSDEDIVKFLVEKKSYYGLGSVMKYETEM